MEASRIFDALKRNPSSESVARNREKLKNLQTKGTQRVQRLVPREAPVAPVTLEKGMSVRVRGHSQQGTLLESPRDGKALVQVGMIKMSFPVAMLEPAEAPAPAVEVARPNRTRLKLQKQQTASMEIVLVNTRAEEAIEKLVRFLDDAVLASMPSVRIVHGKGEGILRKITREQLKSHRGVQSFRDGEPGEGGSGVTIAVLE
jgi:DNA mismatch repair protein MutS2